MVSVERIQQLEKLPTEPEVDTQKSFVLESDWPRDGQIIFKDVSLTYETVAAPALKSISFRINPCEKVGIVGRTGSGKSSLVAAIFRFVEVDGTITIDDVPISQIGLKVLRSKISIIPQDPVLFAGTIRSNLDPFLDFPDYRLWKALEDVHLKETVQNMVEGLCNPVSESGGSIFSVGERQLFCLARAILRSNKIIILDEATANVDLRTDARIQETIREKFSKCTILTIAHRLQTVMDCDRVMVLDDGRIVEFDQPYDLLRRDGSACTAMVQLLDASTKDLLFQIAQKSYVAGRHVRSDLPISRV